MGHRKSSFVTRSYGGDFLATSPSVAATPDDGYAAGESHIRHASSCIPGTSCNETQPFCDHYPSAVIMGVAAVCSQGH